VITWWIVLGVFVVLAVWIVASSVRQVEQYQRGVVFRFGRVLPAIREPGLRFIIPIADRMVKVTMQTVVLGVPAQGAITRDNVTVTVDAVVYFRVVDAPTEGPWGLRIERVELKDISLPETMKRSMSRQAEAERERRARVIAADGEFQASQKLSQAAAAMAATPGALQLRLLQTVVDVAAEKNSTLVMPFPVELLRFFDRAADHGPTGTDATPVTVSTAATTAKMAVAADERAQEPS